MADTRRVDVGSRLRRTAGALSGLGLTLLISSTVALAQDPTPTPEPTSTPVPAVTAEPTPAVTVYATPTPTATVALTPEPSATVVPSPTSVVTAEPTATATAARQAATPTATPAATAEATGATLSLCHALTDGTYEAVTITISDNQLNEHFDHVNDLIPAPATGCGAGAQPDEQVGVCHATGDPEHPYTFAGFKDPSNLDGHESHPGDLIPAPNGTCPGLSEYFVPTVTPTPEPSAEPTEEPIVTPSPTATTTPEPTATATAEVIDEETGGGNGDLNGTVAGARSPGVTASTPATYLPFTGFELQIIALAGLGFVLTGLGLRLLSQPAVGVTL